MRNMFVGNRDVFWTGKKADADGCPCRQLVCHKPLHGHV